MNSFNYIIKFFAKNGDVCLPKYTYTFADINKLLQGVPINMGIESHLWFQIFNAWQRMYKNEIARLTRFSESGVPFSCLKKLTKISDNFIKQIEICTNFVISPSILEYWTVAYILKISRPGVWNWNAAINMLMKKCRMVRWKYKSRHLIPMFLGHPVYTVIRLHLWRRMRPIQRGG